MTGGFQLYAPHAILILAAIATIVFMLRQFLRQVRGELGRAYGEVVEDQLAESVRRAALLVRVAEAREARLARIERRSEGGR